VGAAGETPTVGVVVESRTDANSTSRLARWFSLGTPPARPSGEWRGRAERVCFARLMHRRGRAFADLRSASPVAAISAWGLVTTQGGAV
jgi:hypothetical protein